MSSEANLAACSHSMEAEDTHFAVEMHLAS